MANTRLSPEQVRQHELHKSRRARMRKGQASGLSFPNFYSEKANRLEVFSMDKLFDLVRKQVAR